MVTFIMLRKFCFLYFEVEKLDEALSMYFGLPAHLEENGMIYFNYATKEIAYHKGFFFKK